VWAGDRGRVCVRDWERGWLRESRPAAKSDMSLQGCELYDHIKRSGMRLEL